MLLLAMEIGKSIVLEELLFLRSVPPICITLAYIGVPTTTQLHLRLRLPLRPLWLSSAERRQLTRSRLHLDFLLRVVDVLTFWQQVHGQPALLEISQMSSVPRRVLSIVPATSILELRSGLSNEPSRSDTHPHHIGYNCLCRSGLHIEKPPFLRANR